MCFLGLEASQDWGFPRLMGYSVSKHSCHVFATTLLPTRALLWSPAYPAPHRPQFRQSLGTFHIEKIATNHEGCRAHEPFSPLSAAQGVRSLGGHRSNFDVTDWLNTDALGNGDLEFLKHLKGSLWNCHIKLLTWSKACSKPILITFLI